MSLYKNNSEIPEELIDDIEGYHYCDSQKERCMCDCFVLDTSPLLTEEK